MGWSCDGRPLARAGGVQPGATLPCLTAQPRPQLSLPALTSLVTACDGWLQLVTLLKLVSACYSWLQLVTACHSWLQVVTCCQSLLTACVGRVAGVWVGGVHAGVTGHMSLVCILYLYCVSVLCTV